MNPAGPVHALDEELRTLFASELDRPLDDATFDRLARAIFAYQFGGNAPFRAFCLTRGMTPDSVTRWEEIPAVPARAFRVAPLICGGAEAAERVFRTSGTTGGSGSRGSHFVRDLSLYRAALLGPFRTHLMPGDGARILSLTPSSDAVPDSSLACMIQTAIETFGGEESGFFGRPDGSLDVDGLNRALREAGPATPVLVVGTAFAWVHWLDADVSSSGIALPEGSVLMETGGFKGRSRAVAREELYASLSNRTGVPVRRIVNEYGMTEMLSQFYEPVLRSEVDQAGADRVSGRWLLPPPWVRMRVLDPATLDPVPSGEIGVLAHYDLANLHSVTGILTSDLGLAGAGGRIRIVGRPEGAEPRGCSLTMEEFLESGAGMEGAGAS